MIQEGDEELCTMVSWLHVHETVKMILVSMAQIELTLSDGDHNVTGLGEYFTLMAAHLRQMNSFLENNPATPQAVKTHGKVLEAQIDQGIMAFQFYDRLSQRLEHVVHGLELTEKVLMDPVKRLNRHCWEDVQAEIKLSYSLECERKMFDLVLQGTPLAEALAVYRNDQDAPKDDIELF
ncbi:hypothetical protein KU855_13470 [Shewanella sp. NIFS-20-20]|nr:hypothetical protein [Shewanella sp. NIFS-20-20]